MKYTFFDVFFRKIPESGGYVVAAGLESIISYIKNMHFTEEDIALGGWVGRGRASKPRTVMLTTV